MRTITKVLDLYTFDELSEDVKQYVINKQRESLYTTNDFHEWAKDDCFILEPTNKELTAIFGNDFYNLLNKHLKYKDRPLIGNNRNILFDSESNYLDISKAMEINNTDYFFKWLGIDSELIEKIDFEIVADSIEIMNQSDKEFTDKEFTIIDKATNKFEQHCKLILERLTNSENYYYSDNAIIEDFAANEIEFLENGKIYND